MNGYNKVILTGNLTRDIDLRYTSSGLEIGTGGLAINRSWTKDGEKKSDTTFVDFTLFGKSAEVLAKYTQKGGPLMIEGRLRNDSWEDKTTGQKRSKLTVLVDNFILIGSKEDSGGAKQAPRAPSRPPEDREPEEDDVPF